MARGLISLILFVAIAARAAAGQSSGPPAEPDLPAHAAALPFAIGGPPPPEPPAVVSRDASGRATVRAVRLTSPLRIDGALDEAMYEAIPSISDFIQSEPIENAPATEKTEVWVFFDADHVYVVARLWVTEPDRMVANEMQRDSRNIPQNENFAFAFDTFYDRRNGVFFELTPLGGRMDAQVTNERSVNNSWNPVWEFATGRFDRGWAVETKIPFKSLRYRPGRAQIWGFNVRRRDQWKNEVSNLVPIPASFGNAGHFRAISLAATLVGLEAPSGSKNLEIKPYGITSLTTDNVVRPRIANEPAGDWGADLKYGIAQNLTADFTYNTDFAQVEADEQQVNLTRFSLFFPEKRDFFLENQGIFEFGGQGGSVGGGGGGGGGGSARRADTSNVPVLFYSRRMGLAAGGAAVPIVAGGRLTGRVGNFSLGVMNIQADDVPAKSLQATNFSVVRVKRDILRKSSVGVALTRRSTTEAGPGSNEAYGVDGAFGFYDNLNINTYWAETRSPGRPTDAVSYRGQLEYAGDRYGVVLERLRVGANFNPEIGFVRHADMRRSFGQVRFSPRPRQSTWIRKLFWTGSVDYIENGQGRVDTRQHTGEFSVDFNNTDRFQLQYTNTYELLTEPLRLTPTSRVPAGGYHFGNLLTAYTFGQGRSLASGNVGLEHGTFYDGHKTTFSLGSGRVAFPPHLTIQPTYSLNRVDLAFSRFSTHLVGSRVNVNVTPLMFVAALLQYNSTNHALSANVRVRWEYRPGSELFVVYNDQRDTSTRGYPDLQNRSFVIKINRLFRF